MDTGTFHGFDLELDPKGVAWFTFNNPENMNGMYASLKRDLIEMITQARMDDAVRVLVFIGTGKAFSAGDDLKGYAKDAGAVDKIMPPIPHGHHDTLGTYTALKTISQALNQTVRGTDKITIAAINGYAIQTGLSLALSCDFRIAAESARLGSATLRFALLPDEGGQHLLVQHLGLGRALDFMLRKKIVSGHQALELGLVHQVVPDKELRSATEALAHEMADGPQMALRFLKRSVHNAAELTFEQACDEIAAKTAISDHHPDAREGTTAFAEKRAPDFRKSAG
jgi:2-(1,2-epoxy-1,2-dihydrophenyl)acetyl-CoA isomerase